MSVSDEVGILLVERKKIREKPLQSKDEGKRPFFPEDIVESYICFHFGLLSLAVTARPFAPRGSRPQTGSTATKQSPRKRGIASLCSHVCLRTVQAMTPVNKKSLHPLRDEGVLRGTTPNCLLPGHSFAVTGCPGAGYFFHQRSPLAR